MKTLNMYYANLGNMGDQLNKLIVEEIFDCKVKRHTYLTATVSGIGSGLGQFIPHGNVVMQFIERVTGLLFPDVTIWGSGFYNYSKQDKSFYRKNIKFAAVRGELSKQRVEKILGHKTNIPTGDAGILAPCLIHQEEEKKYEVGIIAHMNELVNDMDTINRIAANYHNSKVIKVTDDPLTVVREIAQCKVIISSSLHGLIVADGFGIPNAHIVITEKLGGDGFKFDDYYSGYHVEHTFIDIRKETLPSIEEVIAHYKIPRSEVLKKQKMLIDVFPCEVKDNAVFDFIK